MKRLTAHAAEAAEKRRITSSIEEGTSLRGSFSYDSYRSTYTPKHRSRGSATLPHVNFAQRQALFREAKRRLEHGVPVGVLIRDVTHKLRVIAGQGKEMRHV